MTKTENGYGLLNYVLSHEEDHTMAKIPPGYEIAEIRITYRRNGGEESFFVTQQVLTP